MQIREILKKEIEKIKPSEKELVDIDNSARDICKKIKEKLKSRAEIFIGGSLAKGTILKKEGYDVDIFVRFNKKYKDSEISEMLDNALPGNKVRVHGSRDYFQIKQGKILFEIIPVTKILSVKEVRNVTDLSYLHVAYIKNKIKKNKNLADEIMLAKSFCYSQKAYGAESYIKGFSGYALELLVSYYKSFQNFIKAVVKNKIPIVLDPEKYYKNKEEVMNSLNEAKLSSPIVFVDPTFKERNALAALSSETFEKFKQAAKLFLKKPSISFFEIREINEKNYNFIIKAETDKQEGDIAGSKLLKFSRFLEAGLNRYFEIKNSEFVYNGKKEAVLYFNIKPRKQIIIEGPPVNKIENMLKFKSRHKNVFIKQGKVFAKEKGRKIKDLISEFKVKNKEVMKSMGITKLV